MTRTPREVAARIRAKARLEDEISGVRTQPALPAVKEQAASEAEPKDWTKSDSFRPPTAGHVDYVQLPKRRRS